MLVIYVEFYSTKRYPPPPSLQVLKECCGGYAIGAPMKQVITKSKWLKIYIIDEMAKAEKIYRQWLGWYESTLKVNFI